MSSAVPDGWGYTTVNDTCEVLDSKRIPLNAQERALRQGYYPYYGANGVQGYIDGFIFDGEHVLLAEDGGYFDEWDSRPISYLVSGKFWVNNHAHILKANEENSTRFIHYSLVHKNILKHINGGTRAKLNQSDMREIGLLAPPLPEQQKIAAILSSVDDVIEKTQAQIDKLKDLKTGMMQELLTKGIGHTEFKDSPVGRIPVGWDVSRFDDVTIKIQDGTHFSPKSKEGPCLYLTSKNIQDGRLKLNNISFISQEEHDAIYKRCNVQFGDVLLTKDGANTGNCALNTLHEPFSLLSSVAFLRCDTSKCLNEFLYQYILSPMFQQVIRDSMTGNAITRLTLTLIKGMRIALPSIAEQEKISNSLSAIDRKVDCIEKKLISLKNAKKALMQDLLTGTVRVKVD